MVWVFRVSFQLLPVNKRSRSPLKGVYIQFVSLSCLSTPYPYFCNFLLRLLQSLPTPTYSSLESLGLFGCTPFPFLIFFFVPCTILSLLRLLFLTLYWV